MDPLLATLVGAGLVTSIEWPRPGPAQRTYKLARVQRLVADALQAAASNSLG
jgi:hypothetical protein